MSVPSETTSGSIAREATAGRTSYRVRSIGMGRPRSPQGRAREAHRRLGDEYPDARCELDHRNPFELLAATILSAQCTDKRVNLVTPGLFARYPDAEALAGAEQGELEEVVRSTGFYANKARNLIGMAQRLDEVHGGEVPAGMPELTALPGVGRKLSLIHI